MPSQLYKNEAVTFLCGRNFTWGETSYTVGDEFDQELAPGRIEQLVRTRHIIPVVDEVTDKPRHFHREVKVRAHVEQQFAADRVSSQIVIERKEPEEGPDARAQAEDEPVEKPTKKTASRKKAK